MTRLFILLVVLWPLPSQAEDAPKETGNTCTENFCIHAFNGFLVFHDGIIATYHPDEEKLVLNNHYLIDSLDMKRRGPSISITIESFDEDVLEEDWDDQPATTCEGLDVRQRHITGTPEIWMLNLNDGETTLNALSTSEFNLPSIFRKFISKKAEWKDCLAKVEAREEEE